MKKSIPLSLPEQLRAWREFSQLSQGQVAKRLGYTSAQFVSNWERGCSRPPLCILPRLAKVLGVSRASLTEAVMAEYQNMVQRRLLVKLKRKVRK